jgi:hypothetical protein
MVRFGPVDTRAVVDDDTWRGRNWLRWDPEQVQEWLRQNNLIYGGLVAIGVAQC